MGAKPVTAIPGRLASCLPLLLFFALTHLLISHRAAVAAADASIPARCIAADLGTCPDCQRLTNWTFNFAPDTYAPSNSARFESESGCRAFCFVKSAAYWSLSRAGGSTVCSCYSSCGSGLSTMSGLEFAVVGAVPFDVSIVGCRTARPVMAGCFCPNAPGKSWPVPWGKCKYSSTCLGYMCTCAFHEYGKAVRDPTTGRLQQCVRNMTRFKV